MLLLAQASCYCHKYYQHSKLTPNIFNRNITQSWKSNICNLSWQMKVRHFLNVGLKWFQCIPQYASHKMVVWHFTPYLFHIYITTDHPSRLHSIQPLWKLQNKHKIVVTCLLWHNKGDMWSVYIRPKSQSSFNGSTQDMNKLHFTLKPIH